MKTNLMVCLVSLVLSSGFISTVSAEDEGWKWSNLNPFKKSEVETPRPRAAKKTHGSVSDDSSKGWSLLPSWSKSEAPAKPASHRSGVANPNEPSAWEKFSTGTKNFASKTKETLMPWSKPEPTPQRRAPTGLNLGSARKPAAEKKSGFGSWFSGGEEEPKEPKTVGEFLSQPRPSF